MPLFVVTGAIWHCDEQGAGRPMVDFWEALALFTREQHVLLERQHFILHSLAFCNSFVAISTCGQAKASRTKQQVKRFANLREVSGHTGSRRIPLRLTREWMVGAQGLEPRTSCV
jgi:hypothetical protein